MLSRQAISHTLHGTLENYEIEEKKEKIYRPMKIRFRMYTDDITEEWSIRDVGIKRMPVGWEGVFSRMGSTFEHIQKTIQKMTPGQIVPEKKNLFRAFHLCPLQDVKVLIIGQDPYYTIMNDGTPDATGLAFATWKEARLRESVENIFLEVKSNYPTFQIPKHGDLTVWAERGVLLLNASLTTIAGVDRAHPNLWDGLITAVIDEIKENCPHTVVMLWGKDAQKLAIRLGKLTYLTASHPSNRSAYAGFFGCEHFRKANEILQSKGKTGICWDIL